MFPCPNCPFSAPSANATNFHRAFAHDIQDEFQCTVCKETFQSQAAAVEHSIQVHQSQKRTMVTRPRGKKKVIRKPPSAAAPPRVKEEEVKFESEAESEYEPASEEENQFEAEQDASEDTSEENGGDDENGGGGADWDEYQEAYDDEGGYDNNEWGGDYQRADSPVKLEPLLEELAEEPPLPPMPEIKPPAMVKLPLANRTTCAVCMESFADEAPAALRIHIIKSHAVNLGPRRQCTPCEKQFTKMSQLLTHFYAVHTTKNC